MKIIFRSFALIGFAAVVLWLMGRANLIDFSMIQNAFQHEKGFVLLTIGVQLLIFILLMYRYVLTVRAFSVRVPTKDMAAATFVSVAIGQWAPGAMAIMEVIRMGLMFGTNKNVPEEEGVKPRLVAASLYDRLIGFMVILLIGFVASSYLVLLQLKLNAAPATLAPLLALAVFSLCGTLAIIALPFVTRLSASHRILVGLHKRLGDNTQTPSPLTRALQQALAQAEKLRHVLASGGSNLKSFSSATFVSLVASVLMSVAIYTAALAVGTPIPLTAIIASFPVVAIASLLPMGFAGMGGYQLVTVAVFHIFGVDARVAASANLLQTALSLLTCTALGLLFARSSLHQIRALLSRKKAIPV
jgi:uncharacterized protein (TIRG00374 family)